MKKITSVIIGLVAAGLCLTGCSKKSDDTKIKIGVLKYGSFNALDSNFEGFRDGLAEAGYVDGQNITIDLQDAQADAANCNQIADKFVNDKVDLIFAIATPAAQAVANKTQDIPVVISSVTDPAKAKLVLSNEMPGTNVTGTSDDTPVREQIELLKTILPAAKTVGLIYSSDEDNSVIQIATAKKACEEQGLKYIEASISNTNEIQQVVQSLVGKVDALYTPTDNKIAASMATVAMVADENKIPVFVAEEGMVKSGGLITVGINYYELGKQTAAMAVEILKGEKKPAEMPIQYQKEFTITSNPEKAAYLGLTLPESK